MGCDGLGVAGESGDELRQLAMAAESPELAFGLEHSGGAPANG